MSIEKAETLKSELTDKWVVVDRNVPELRRFSGLTGRVKTVNMNCQALVEFDGVEDIAWYDIDPDFLNVVDGPAKKEKPAAPAKDAKPAAKAAKPSGGGSPLDQIRKQGAGGGAKAEKPSGKASPLDLIRKQGAPGSGGDAGADDAATESKPAAPVDAGKKLSPLEQIRQQGAPGSKKAAPAAESSEAPARPPATAAGDADDENLSPIERIRRQGAPGSNASAPAEEPAADAPAETARADDAEDLSGLSIIEIIRRQGGPKD